jgi:hypothetical protein
MNHPWNDSDANRTDDTEDPVRTTRIRMLALLASAVLLPATVAAVLAVVPAGGDAAALSTCRTESRFIPLGDRAGGGDGKLRDAMNNLVPVTVTLCVTAQPQAGPLTPYEAYAYSYPTASLSVRCDGSGVPAGDVGGVAVKVNAGLVATSRGSVTCDATTTGPFGASPVVAVTHTWGN